MDFKQEISLFLSNYINKSGDFIKELLEIPKDSDMGDYAFPCFLLSKELKKSPQMIASELFEKIGKNPFFLEKIEAKGPYINFFIKHTVAAEQILSEIFSKKENYGKSDIGQGGVVAIDYSSPNIGKPFHIGHLRSTIIGHALYNIFDALGYKPYSINFLGDWGTQFGKLITAYKHWGEEEALNQGGITELNRLYVKFHEEVDKNKELDNEARAWLVKMEQGDEYALRLWSWFKDISMANYAQIYKRLNISFDSYNGESFYNDKMQPVVQELIEKNLLVDSEGAKIVDLEEYKMPPCLILRRDGGTLYPTRDIASALYRKKEYDFVKALYVTDHGQHLHFAQWFKVVELMGYDWAKDLRHIPFGLISFADGKLSTRKGNVLLMDDLLNDAVSKIAEIINEKNPSLENKAKVSEQVGIGAIKFNDLYNGRIKDIEFSWERMLNFEGETGPYVQYTYARCASVLRKADINYNEPNFELLTNEDEFSLIKTLAQFPEKIKEAADKLEPSVVSRYVMLVAQAFNRFYHNNTILKAEDGLKAARLALTECAKITIAQALQLLGIETPEEM